MGDILPALDNWRLHDSKNAVDSTWTPDIHSRVDCEMPNPNFSEIAFFDGYFRKFGILEFSFQAVEDLVCCRCTEILAISIPKSLF
jgi:hypothetical protein